MPLVQQLIHVWQDQIPLLASPPGDHNKSHLFFLKRMVVETKVPKILKQMMPLFTGRTDFFNYFFMK